MAFLTVNGKLSPYQDEIPLLKTGKNILSEYREKTHAIIVFMIYSHHLCIQNIEEFCSEKSTSVFTKVNY